MNIHNINAVKRIWDSLGIAEKRLASINKFPQMVKVTYSGEDLGVDARNEVISVLQAYYQKQANSYVEQLTQLGVDLSPLPQNVEEDEE